MVVALPFAIAFAAAGAAATSTDVAGAVLPPPYRGGAGSLVVRVGLETDLQQVTVPCCEPVAIDGGARRVVASGLEVKPGGQAQKATYKLQAAALKDEDQALALAAVLERSTGVAASASFDVASSLYRVRLGRFDTRDAAERFRQRVAEQGLAEGWVVAEGGGLERAALIVRAGGESREAAGRWLVIEPEAGPGVRLERGRYRGRLLVYLNDRGLLNLINELPIEDYLRGVVPVEMGPDLYDSVESLKAQAVAARTFAVRGLSGFALEGFDLCASPRCQAYGGMGAEHPLSDRAVQETASEVVLYDGEIAEALYSASCGGATEDVEVVFPRKTGAYLRGVPCPERGVVRLDSGAEARGATYAHRLLEQLAPPAGAAPGASAGATRSGAPAAQQATIEAMLRLAGLPVPADALASLERSEVRRYLASALDLAIDARVLHDPAPEPSDDWSADERRLHARFSSASGAAAARLSTSEMEEVAFDVARLLGVAVEERAYFLGYDQGSLEVRTGAQRRALAIGPSVATFARRGGELEGAALDLAPGDRLRLAWSRGRLLAVVADHDGPGETPRVAPPWTVFRREDELRRSVATLYPGFALRDFEVVSRGPSGRVGKLRLLGQHGDTVMLEGLAVRWTLGIPETWFDARREVRSGQRGWAIEGRGRGHGVGLCQIGAVAMSRRGQSYREILAHYYSGAKLGRLQT